RSFLKGIQTHWIPSGIDLEKFNDFRGNNIRDKYRLGSGKIVLGVASIWNKRKGLSDFLLLRSLLPEEYTIVLIGVPRDRIRSLPNGVVGVPRTENTDELAEWY